MSSPPVSLVAPRPGALTATRRQKNIVVCSDGTGNTAIKGRGTNVFKLFEAVDLNSHRTNPALDAQVALYDDGGPSGTGTSSRCGRR